MPVPEGSGGGGVASAWPLLHELAAAGVWRGTMHYAAGADGMSPTPMMLDGTTRVTLQGLALSS